MANSNHRAAGNGAVKKPKGLRAPLRLFLGEAALGVALNRYADRLATWVTWAEVSRRAQG